MKAAGAYRNKTLGKEEVTDWCLLAGGTGQCSFSYWEKHGGSSRPQRELQPKDRFKFLGNSDKMHPCVQRNPVSSFKAPTPTSPSDSCLRAHMI